MCWLGQAQGLMRKKQQEFRGQAMMAESVPSANRQPPILGRAGEVLGVGQGGNFILGHYKLSINIWNESVFLNGSAYQWTLETFEDAACIWQMVIPGKKTDTSSSAVKGSMTGAQKQTNGCVWLKQPLCESHSHGNLLGSPGSWVTLPLCGSEKDFHCSLRCRHSVHTP